MVFKLRMNGDKPQAEVIGREEDLYQQANEKLLEVGPGPYSGIIKSYNEGKV